MEEKKEYSRNLQHLQTQQEIAQEQRKNLGLAGVKKMIEDYEQILQCYTLMRTKNKMKNSKAKFEKWWEVAEEYFIKELEKN